MEGSISVAVETEQNVFNVQVNPNDPLNERGHESGTTLNVINTELNPGPGVCSPNFCSFKNQYSTGSKCTLKDAVTIQTPPTTVFNCTNNKKIVPTNTNSSVIQLDIRYPPVNHHHIHSGGTILTNNHPLYTHQCLDTHSNPSLHHPGSSRQACVAQCLPQQAYHQAPVVASIGMNDNNNRSHIYEQDHANKLINVNHTQPTISHKSSKIDSTV